MTECYRCEKCGAVYDTKELALRCEDRHKDVKEIYHKDYGHNAEYPQSIIVKFSDESYKTYYLSR